MREIIARINSSSDYVEIACVENAGAPMFKKINASEFANIVVDVYAEKEFHHMKDLKLLDPQIIAMNEYFVVVKQPGDKKIVTFKAGDDIFTYKINFPNSIYIIELSDSKNKVIRGIECYSYIEYKGEETKLYEYPMPNELSGNKICIGNADRTVKDGDVVSALERIIFTPYSHRTFSGMNGFSQSQAYFEYLEKNDFPYKMMKPLKRKLKDVLKG